jgi:FkbM family methyltransferase
LGRVGDQEKTVKLTKEGIAIAEMDNCLSKDIETTGRLDVARDLLLAYRQYMPEGGTVCDVGACLGDYTATFSEFVGPRGHVYAIEPNPVTVECLEYNMKAYPNVTVYAVGLGARSGRANVMRDWHNLAASQLQTDEAGEVSVVTLDSISPAWDRIDFLKIDAEGFEPMLLDGSKATIARFRPVIWIEVSGWMMGRLNTYNHERSAEDVYRHMSVEETYKRLDALNYHFTRSERDGDNILCLP